MPKYDLAHGMVRLMVTDGDCRETNLAYWAGSTPVSELKWLRERSDRLPAIKGSASLNGQRVTVLFDTGAPTSVVSLAAALRAGISKDDMKPAKRVGGLGKHDVPAWSARIESFEIGGERIWNSRLEVADFDMGEVTEMPIGLDFFLSHRI